MDERKYCAIDIDGILNYYPSCWIDYVNEKIDMQFDTLDSMKLSLSYRDYKRLKSEYRESGVKENLMLRDKAKQTIDSLYDAGFDVIIISARPVEKHPTLYGQTIRWLMKNEIRFSNILFSDKKQYEVIKYYPGLKFMVEDNSRVCNIMANIGYKMLILENDCNAKNVLHNSVEKIYTIESVLQYAD